MQVIHRDHRRVAVYGSIAAAAAVAALTAVLVLTALVRRARRADNPQDA
ncbi:hypothetical protein ACFQGX_09710 [Nonomuraea dietziae]